MFTVTQSSEIPNHLLGSYLAIGNFDGVHRGHAQLLEHLRHRADAAGVPSVVLSFEPHPLAILAPERLPPSLSSTERTVELVSDLGVSEVGLFLTGPWLLSLTAREFFDGVIRGRFRARGLVEGPTFSFGKDRSGDADQLQRWCGQEDIDLHIVQPIELEGELVSSTRIRKALEAGWVELASRLLGRPHRLRGLVVRGVGRGAKLGFPTANLEKIQVQLPADGVYAALVGLDDASRPHPAALHIGSNATFGAQTRTIEAHLIDFAGDLYGRTIDVDIVASLRPTQRFDSVEALIAQMRRDIATARTRLQSP